ncbi:MAG TPA: Hsp20/alpha crystallin family protein [Acidimicrobiales bacterium]|jgi:HSP20 family protein|nr:Hsp20/alpha crystallin family protein [Acidimicrobiales bacterium]
MTKPMTDRLTDRQARRDGTAGEAGGETMQVPVNVYQADQALVVVAPLPGVMPADVEVVVDGTEVTIRAAMRTPAPKEYLVHEWHYGPFERTITVPEGYAGEAKASFGNGQLALSLGRGDSAGAPSQVIRPA